MTKEEALFKYWGYREFRSKQAEIINAVLDKKDVLCLLPTGGGKSLCYQLPTMLKEGICVVVSPLVSLIEDQVNTLNAKGIKALGLIGGMKTQEVDQLLDNCIYGTYKFLYLSPERLTQPLVWKRLQKMNISLIAIDEAHCISQWGHDFRPSYLNCSLLKEQFDAPLIALTATATKEVEQEIKTLLQLEDPFIAKESFKRSNLSYQLIHTNDKPNYLIGLCQRFPGTAIVYANNRGLCKQLSERLNQHHIKSEAFHGGLDKEQKSKILKDWKTNKIKVVVATSAFGMGVDKAAVQLIVHYQLPESLEQYYQETGRAGRNGEQAHTFVLYQASDDQKMIDQYLGQYPTTADINLLYKHLNNYFSIAYGELPKQRFSLDLHQFCLRYQLNASKTFNTLKVLDKHQVLELDLTHHYQTKVQFIASKSSYEALMDQNPTYATILKVMWRAYGGLFELPTAIHLPLIAEHASISTKQLLAALSYFKELNLISLEQKTTDLQLLFKVPREDHYTINQFRKIHDQSLRHKKQQLQACITYAHLKEGCRRVYLLHYFGEQSKPCHQCDLCTKAVRSSSIQEVKSAILKLLGDQQLDSKTITLALDYTENSIFEAIKELLATNTIAINATNHYYKK